MTGMMRGGRRYPVGASVVPRVRYPQPRRGKKLDFSLAGERFPGIGYAFLRSITMDLTDLTNKLAGVKFVPPHCGQFR
ncbi:hypothetical protein [Burkholderia sp. Ac-20365]|jgi:hypothetical protein|uniref:hypothetical protein n=1 Tax=Burkholderia sp. Ac-20365 TaxID=2703897 RepID=UPI00197C5C44|nr:hypothetical protein [Burkholderia sp. Ac-20365]MBN3763231.1 hypothetical protein [Burkholderia sp. Ac-20365]